MAKICDVCGKGVLFVRRRKHNVRTSQWRFRATAKPRKLSPNLRKIDAYINGTPQKVKVCMKCYKKLRSEN